MTNEIAVHKYLTGFEKYNQKLPIYIEKPFSKTQVDSLKNIIYEAKQKDHATDVAPGDKEEFTGKTRFEPRAMTHMSRLIIEFICPKDIEETMDKYAKPLYKDDISLAHYSYIDYDTKYGDNRYAPSLPPHIDSNQNLVTFNYQLDGNIDWELYIDDKPYNLKTGDAIIFSAVNQVHWRPKRKWKSGEFLEIITFDYCPPDDWRLLGTADPLDIRLFPETVKQYFEDLQNNPIFQNSWNLYDKLGVENGISQDQKGKLL